MANELRFHPAWFMKTPACPPDTLETPLDAARWEADELFAACGARVSIAESAGMGEKFRISGEDGQYLVTGGKTGALYGVHALLRALLTCGKVPQGERAPYYPLRMLNGWDNPDGTVERGYAGRSLWFEGGRFSYDPARIRCLGRMLSSVGVNALCVNNVNVSDTARRLIAEDLDDLKRFADILRPFGVRLMVSVDFAMPAAYGLDTADPLDENVRAWWHDRAAAVYEAVPDLAGFLVKADSEHRPGPHTYGRTHAEGANTLARALRPFGGTLLWRAFVYNCKQDWRDHTTDRPRAAFDLYHPMDGQFDDNVIVQVKNGPYDFQVREPVSPLFFGMDHTHMALEVQLAQEYTGQQIDIYAMPPQWREIFDQAGPERFAAAAAVTNLGRDFNWTGHPFAQLNLFAYGLFAWDPMSDPKEVTRQWIHLTFGFSPRDEDTLAALLLSSRSVYEKYTAPLGLCWMVSPDRHYGPSPYGYEFQAWGTYNRADRNAVGIDRTKAGTGYAEQYPPEMRDLYSSPDTCPDDLLLFFHRLKYTYVMRDGRTLIQRIYDDHFEGEEAARRMADALKALPFPDGDRQVILGRMDLQLKNAREWRDVTNTFFYRFSGIGDEKGRTIWP